MSQSPGLEPDGQSRSAEREVKGFGARVGSDLGPRVVSAVVLAAIALSAIWFGREPLAVLLAIVGGIVAWEWGRIVRGAELDAATVAHIATVFAGIVLTGFGWAGPAIIGVLIGTILTGLLSFGRHSTLSSVGVLFAGLPGIALLWLRSDEPLGAAAVYFIVAVVAATDIAAYFCGRLIGGAKLWSRVSPKKTWSGLLGGVTAAATTGFVTAQMVPGAHALHLTVMGGVLALVAQCGDLAESALKRRFGAKDASQLIPGHGGFMDRVDGLATAAVVAAAWAASFGMSTPARALLTW